MSTAYYSSVTSGTSGTCSCGYIISPVYILYGCVSSGSINLSATIDQAGTAISDGFGGTVTVPDFPCSNYLIASRTGYYATSNGCGNDGHYVNTVSGASYTNYGDYGMLPCSGYSSETVNIYITVTGTITSTYTISTSCGSGGSISSSTTVNEGESATIYISPNSGYSISDVTVDGVSVGITSSYTFSNVTSDHSISASFVYTPVTYSIYASAGTGGSISPSGYSYVSEYGSITYTITPNTGYYISKLIVDGSTVGAATSFSFENVTSNHTISAEFASETTYYTIDVTDNAVSGVTLNPSTDQSIESGGSMSFYVTNTTSNYLPMMSVDGGTAINRAFYTFSNVTSNRSIKLTSLQATLTAASNIKVTNLYAEKTATISWTKSITNTNKTIIYYVYYKVFDQNTNPDNVNWTFIKYTGLSNVTLNIPRENHGKVYMFRIESQCSVVKSSSSTGSVVNETLTIDYMPNDQFIVPKITRPWFPKIDGAFIECESVFPKIGGIFVEEDAMYIKHNSTWISI